MWWVPFATGAISAFGQKREADRINRAQRSFERINTKFAKEALLSDYAALAARRIQDRRVLASSLEQVTMDAQRRAGDASVAAGESGVKGRSTAALLDQFRIAQLKSEQNAMDSEQFMQEQYQREIDSARAQAISRILGGKQQRAPEPNYLGIFMDSMVGYMQYQSQMDRAQSNPAPWHPPMSY